jgi:centromeric protein E
MCIFSGQTSSGKTHSVLGYDGDKGIIPMAMKHIFDHIKTSRREWLLRVSYLEVYNEQLHDLLQPNTPSHKLVIFEDELGHTQVKNVQEEIVRSEADVMNYLSKGTQNRHIGKTAMNAQSSRSHAVFTMIIESKELEQNDSFRFASKTSLKEKGAAVTVSNLYMVDLAGSERSDKTQSQGKTLGEGTFINKSLLTLSRCITQLAKAGGKKSFIAYRDSKLTRLIRVGLGGNSKLSVLCCITPGISHYSESVSTMRFGQSARQIQNKSTVNQVKDESALLKQYKREIDLLKQKLEMGSTGDNDSIKQELEQHKRERLELESALKEITDLILVGEIEQGAESTDGDTDAVVPTSNNALSVDSDTPGGLSDYEADSDVSTGSNSGSPSLSIKTSILSATRHARAGSMNLRDSIRHLKDTIASDKMKLDEIQKCWDRDKEKMKEERKKHESERERWEGDRSSLKTAEKTFRIKELDFLEKKNEWKKREHEYHERLKIMMEDSQHQRNTMKELLEEERQMNKKNSVQIERLATELEETRKETRLQSLPSPREMEINVSLLEVSVLLFEQYLDCITNYRCLQIFSSTLHNLYIQQSKNKSLELKSINLKNELEETKLAMKQQRLKIEEFETLSAKYQHENNILQIRNTELQLIDQRNKEEIQLLQSKKREETVCYYNINEMH